MIEQELKDKIVNAIKEKNTESKPQLTGLFHQLMDLYVAEDKLKIANLIVNSKRCVKINDFANQVASFH
jgi:hypothetical protein